MIDVLPLTEAEKEAVAKSRKELWNKFRNTPEDGVEVDYLGKTFIVYPNVFYPHEDSKPLVQNFVVNKGEHVLDIGTGSGVIAIFAAYMGAAHVVALDINPDAVRTANVNTKRHHLNHVIEVRLSDGLKVLRADEKFDVVTGNFPFSDDKPSDLVEMTVLNEGLTLYKQFFATIKDHLNPNARIYLSQANFGAFEELIRMANESNFDIECIGKNVLENDPRVFYAFKLKVRD